MTKYWLLKSEPGTYSWDNLVKDKTTFWDGVRNYQARNNLKLMKLGDMAFFYHSVNEKKIVGVSKIITEYYQDPSTADENWVAVDIEALYPLKRCITLEDIKKDGRLTEMVLVKNTRLSVQPVTEDEFNHIIALSEQ
ncbi:MAG: EVE domain-containing protein [Cyclobacteriaceae bacterium]|nr:EVE domain-containing protein [Cyclobacteriaceae bacterium]